MKIQITELTTFCPNWILGQKWIFCPSVIKAYFKIWDLFSGFETTRAAIAFWKMMSWWGPKILATVYENCGENTRKSSTVLKQTFQIIETCFLGRSARWKTVKWWWGTCCVPLYHKMGPVSLCFLSHPVLLKTVVKSKMYVKNCIFIALPQI